MQDTAKQHRAEHDREVEAEIIVAVLYTHAGSCSRSDLERHFAQIDVLDLNDALARLNDHGAVQIEGECVQVSDSQRQRQNVDQLAAVVLYHLTTTSDPKVVSTERVTREVERDPQVADEQREVDVALRLLVADELAHRRPQGWEASRAAVRASELSF